MRRALPLAALLTAGCADGTSPPDAAGTGGTSGDPDTSGAATTGPTTTTVGASTTSASESESGSSDDAGSSTGGTVDPPMYCRNETDGINPDVAALGDNQWIVLPTPELHPRVQSGSPWMSYAPEARRAILWGTTHSGSTNGVWSYEAATNTWTVETPDEASLLDDPDVVKFQDETVMTRNGAPLAFHQWGKQDYDTDRHALWHYVSYTWGWQGTINIFDYVTTFTPDDTSAAFAAAPGPTFFEFDLDTDAWTVVHTDYPGENGWGEHSGAIGTIRYFPPLAKFIATPVYATHPVQFRAYDPDANTWSVLDIAGMPDPAYFSGHPGMVYDAVREVLWINDGAQGTWKLDPVGGTIEQVVPLEETPTVSLDGNVGVFLFDHCNATPLTIFTAANVHVYEADAVLAARGFPVDDSYVYALDVDAGTWVRQPIPDDGVRPPDAMQGLDHAYFDPVQNAAFVFEGGYGSTNGQMWVYRLRRADG